MITQLLRLRNIYKFHQRVCRRIPLRCLASSLASGHGRPKAVVFDMGGVVIPSPVHYFTEFEEQYGLPKGAIVAAIMAGGEKG